MYEQYYRISFIRENFRKCQKQILKSKLDSDLILLVTYLTTELNFTKFTDK